MMETWTTDELVLESDDDGDPQVTARGTKDDGAKWIGQFQLVPSMIEPLRDKLNEWLDANRD